MLECFTILLLSSKFALSESVAFSYLASSMALCGASQQLALISGGNGHQRRGRISRSNRGPIKVQASTSSELGVYEEGRLERPDWSGQTPLSRLVGALISFKPLYSILKLGARQVLIRSTPICLFLGN